MEMFFIGFVTSLVLTTILVNIMLRIAKKHTEQQLKEIAETIKAFSANQIQARVEEDDGVFYVYRVDDNTFLAQGTTMAELRERIESRMKEAMVYVTEGDAEVLSRLKATSPESTHA
jgi:predicted RNase H-like HicB family nuclease